MIHPALSSLINKLVQEGSISLLVAILGFLVLAYFLKEGLSLARAYAQQKEHNQEDLLNFIRNTQNRLDASQHSFMVYLNESSKILQGIADRISNSESTHADRHSQVMLALSDNMDLERRILEELWKRSRPQA